jgi:xanthine dehydrogenase/oxidase
LDNCKYFAGHQVRNVASLAGNICTASPISDLNPVFVALGAEFVLESLKGKRTVNARSFFQGYRKTSIQPDEILTEIVIPFTNELEYASAFKQAKRRDDDIAIVNSGFFLSLENAGGKMVVKDCCLAFGGMGPMTMQANSTAEFLRGQVWSPSTVDKCFPLILQDLPLSATAPGGQIEFRKSLGNFILPSIKFLLQV